MSEVAPHVETPAAAPPASAAIARNAFHLVLGQAGTLGLSLVLSAALARSLGAADFGLLYLLTSMTVFAYVFIDWGAPSYLVREVARRPEDAGALLGSSLAFRAGGAVAVSLLGLVAVSLLGYDGRTRALYLVAMAMYLPISGAQTFGHVFRGHERMDHDALVTVLVKALTLALTLPALAWGGRVAAVIVAQGIAGAMGLAVAFALFQRLGLQPLRPSRAVVRELLSGGTPLLAMALAISVQGYIDAVVLSKLAPAEAVGWYGAARNFMNALVMPAAILAAAAYPGLSRAAGDLPRFKQQVRSALRPLLGLGVLGAVGTFLFAELAVSVVYGREKFGPAIAILQVFAPGLLFLFVDTLMGTAVVSSGRPRALAAAKALSVALATGLDLFLVPLCQARLGNGGMGLVIAFGVSELVMLVATFTLAPRGTVDRALLKDLGRALVVGAATLLLSRLLPRMPLALELGVCLAAFAALSLALGLVTASDLALLRSLLRPRGAGPGGERR